MLIAAQFIGGKSADAAILLLVAHHYEIIVSNFVFLVLLDDKTKVLDLSLDLLRYWTWFYYYRWLLKILILIGIWAIFYLVVDIMIYKVLEQGLFGMNIVQLALIKVKIPLSSLEVDSR